MIVEILIAIMQSCYDGDTCKVAIPNVPDVFGKAITVRIEGVDAPEMTCERNKIEAQAARQFLQEHLPPGSIVEIINPKRDKYFRILGDIRLKDWRASEQLLQYGHAIPYNGGKRKAC